MTMTTTPVAARTPGRHRAGFASTPETAPVPTPGTGALTPSDDRPAATPAAGRASGTGLARVLSGLVAVAAGIVGVGMLIAPDATGAFFSWDLGSAPLAALVGSSYVASAAVFGWAALREPWASLRPLCIAVFGLSVPTLLATSQHLAVFDFSRWQAVAWVGLFFGSVTFFGLTLAITREPPTDGGPAVPSWARIVVAAVGALYVLVALSLWLRPDTVAAIGPIDAGPLGLRFVGSWAAFLAVLAGSVVLRPRWVEARMALASLVIWPVLALVAALPQLDALRPGAPTSAYVIMLVLLAVLPAAALMATLRSSATRRQVLR